MDQRDQQQRGSQLAEVLSAIEKHVRDGLRHGFFEYVLTCTTVKNGKRELTLRAGKSHRFVIPDEDLEH